MKYRYSKFEPEDLDGVDLEDLLSRLSDLLLSSGFNDPYSVFDDEEGGHSMQALHDALLEALLNGALSDDMLERLLGPGIELKTSSAEGLPPIYGDPGQIEQAIINIAVNARDAMPDGGRLTISVAMVAPSCRSTTAPRRRARPLPPRSARPRAGTSGSRDGFPRRQDRSRSG